VGHGRQRPVTELMNQEEAIEALTRQGMLPSEIASRLGRSNADVVQSLRSRVGEGELRLSDIYFSWPAGKRRVLEIARKKQRSGSEELEVDAEDLAFFNSLYRRPVFAGDLYEHLAEAEIALHDMTKEMLERECGRGEANWWPRVPEKVSTHCQDCRKADAQRAESKFQYTTILDLLKIIEKNWKSFRDALPTEYRTSKTRLARDFNRLNRIRNTVMHPVKRRRWTDSDFEFAKDMRKKFASFRAK
jgi:predicted transcriptional regulator